MPLASSRWSSEDGSLATPYANLKAQLMYLPIILPRQTLVWQRFNRYMKIVKRTTTIRFFRLADLRYGWVACGFPLHFTCWLSESQIGLKSILFEAIQCAPLITQHVKVKSFIIQSLLDYFLFYRFFRHFQLS